MNIRLDQITADDVGNQRQKKKSKISKKEVSYRNFIKLTNRNLYSYHFLTPSFKDSVDLDALLMAGENMNKENNPNLPKRSIGDWSDSDDDAPPPPKRATRAAKAKPQLEAEAPAKKKQPAKSRKKKDEVKEELAEERKKVANLENQLNSEATWMRLKDEIIETQNQVEHF